MRRAHLFGLIALLTLLPFSAAGVRKLTLEDLTRGASRIVVGDVVSTQAQWEDGRIVTLATVQVDHNLKGSGAAQVVVRIPGGTIGNLTMKVGEAPVLNAGEEVVLFLRPNVCPCDVYGWFQGKFTVVGGLVREMRDLPLSDFESTILGHVQAQEGGK